MLAFYGFDEPRKLLAIPVVTFWMLHKNIDRLMAEKDIRSAEVAVYAQSGDGVRELFKSLKKQMGTVVDFDEVFSRQEEALDRTALQGLRGLGKVNS